MYLYRRQYLHLYVSLSVCVCVSVSVCAGMQLCLFNLNKIYVQLPTTTRQQRQAADKLKLAMTKADTDTHTQLQPCTHTQTGNIKCFKKCGTALKITCASGASFRPESLRVVLLGNLKAWVSWREFYARLPLPMKPFRQAFWLSKNTSGSTVLSQTTPAHLLHYSALCNTSGRGSGKHQMRTAQIENKWRAGRGKRNSQKNSEKNRKRNVLQFLPVGFSFGILAQLRLLAVAASPPPAPLFMQPIRERGQLAWLLTHNSQRWHQHRLWQWRWRCWRRPGPENGPTNAERFATGPFKRLPSHDKL